MARYLGQPKARAIVGLGLLAALVVGCGGSDDAAETASSALTSCDAARTSLLSSVTTSTLLSACTIHVRSDVTIAAGATLQLPRGASVIFHERGKLTVNGSLKAEEVRLDTLDANRLASTDPLVELRGPANLLRNVRTNGSIVFVGSSDNVLEKIFLTTQPRITEREAAARYALSFSGGERNSIRELDAWGGGGVLRVAGSAVRLENASFGFYREPSAPRSPDAGVRMLEGAHVSIAKTLITGFEHAVDSDHSFLEVEDSMLLHSSSDGIHVTNDRGPTPPATCTLGRAPGSRCYSTRGQAPDVIVAGCPVIRRSVIAKNKGAGIHLASAERLQVEASSIEDNLGPALRVDANVIDTTTFIRESNLARNNPLFRRTDGTDHLGPQVVSMHAVGNLPLETNFWGSFFRTPAGTDPDGEAVFRDQVVTVAQGTGAVVSQTEDSRGCLDRAGSQEVYCPRCLLTCRETYEGTASVAPVRAEPAKAGPELDQLDPRIVAEMQRWLAYAER